MLFKQVLYQLSVHSSAFTAFKKKKKEEGERERNLEYKDKQSKLEAVQVPRKWGMFRLSECEEQLSEKLVVERYFLVTNIAIL